MFNLGYKARLCETDLTAANSQSFIQMEYNALSGYNLNKILNFSPIASYPLFFNIFELFFYVPFVIF
jgi:hypothetical protein